MTHVLEYGKDLFVHSDAVTLTTNILTTNVSGALSIISSTSETITAPIISLNSTTLTIASSTSSTITSPTVTINDTTLTLTSSTSATITSPTISLNYTTLQLNSVVFDATVTVVTFTNAAGSARTDVGTALTLYFRKLGPTLVMCNMVGGNLRTFGASVASALLTFNETIPVSLRPAVQNNTLLGLIQNVTYTIGKFQVFSNGTISVAPITGTFTIAQGVQLDWNCTIVYSTV